MRVKIKEFDPSAYLDSDQVIAEYLTAALEDGNPDVFLSAVGNVAKALAPSPVTTQFSRYSRALESN
jgi:probable addiction module antidote protein